MREETRSTVARLPADVLWDYLADYDRVVRLGWDNASAYQLDDSTTCSPRFKAHTTWEGLTSTYIVCREKAERPRTMTWYTKSGGSRNWLRFDLDPLDSDSTRVAVTLHLKHAAPLRALEPFAWGLLKPAFVRTMERLESLHDDGQTR